jgi:hypothetical protein
MILFSLESKPEKRADRRGVEAILSRNFVSVSVRPLLPRLWSISLRLHKISKLEWAEQEKSGLHVSTPDSDGWNTIYYRRPGSLYYGLLVIGRRQTWFEKTAARTPEVRA